MENKLEQAKAIIKKYASIGKYGIFNTRNIVGDYMTNLYDKDGLQIDVCFQWEYFEVFGLTTDEWIELRNFYNVLVDY